jgi:hypothetical protein
MMKIKHALADRDADLYETPDVATHALLRAENLPHYVWECASGPGAIARELRSAGHKVIATDLVDYRSPEQDHSRRDFLLESKAPDGVKAIITNPPFKLAGEFVEHALRLCPRVIMLLRLTFLESTRRTSILDGGQLARVHIFRNRLPMMHRVNWDGPKVSNPTAFAWFVWDRAHRGPTQLHRLSWTPIPSAHSLPVRATAQFEASQE